jgi:hypothetical protein
MSRSILRAAAAGPMIVVVALAALVSGGCRAAEVRPGPSLSPEALTSPTVAPAGGPVPFRVRLDAGQRILPRAPRPDGCPGVDTVVSLGSARTVRFIAYATTCPAGGRQLINGHHGVYRTSADIPADRLAGAGAVPTALGEATVFIQAYSEYTNSANRYTEPVAVITLAHPADPAYRALTVVAEKGTLSRDELGAVLRERLLAP